MTAEIHNLHDHRVALPRIPVPLEGGVHTHTCSICGNGTFFVQSNFDGRYTAVKCIRCRAVMMETQDQGET